MCIQFKVHMHDSSFSRNKQQTVSFTIILSHRKQQFFLLIPRVSWPVPRRKQTWGPTGCGRTGDSPCSNPPAPQSPPGHRTGRAGRPLPGTEIYKIQDTKYFYCQSRVPSGIAKYLKSTIKTFSYIYRKVMIIVKPNNFSLN